MRRGKMSGMLWSLMAGKVGVQGVNESLVGMTLGQYEAARPARPGRHGDGTEGFSRRWAERSP